MNRRSRSGSVNLEQLTLLAFVAFGAVAALAGVGGATRVALVGSGDPAGTGSPALPGSSSSSTAYAPGAAAFDPGGSHSTAWPSGGGLGGDEPIFADASGPGVDDGPPATGGPFELEPTGLDAEDIGASEGALDGSDSESEDPSAVDPGAGAAETDPAGGSTTGDPGTTDSGAADPSEAGSSEAGSSDGSAADPSAADPSAADPSAADPSAAGSGDGPAGDPGADGSADGSGDPSGDAARNPGSGTDEAAPADPPSDPPPAAEEEKRDECASGWRGAWCRAKRKASELWNDTKEIASDAAEWAKSTADSYWKWADDQWWVRGIRYTLNAPWIAIDWVADQMDWLVKGLDWAEGWVKDQREWLAGFRDHDNWFVRNGAAILDGAFAYTENVVIPFDRGLVKGTQGLVQGLTSLLSMPANLLTGEPDTVEFVQTIAEDPIGAGKEMWNGIKDEWTERWDVCISNHDTAKCSESLGTLAPDVAAMFIPGGAALKGLKIFNKLKPDGHGDGPDGTRDHDGDDQDGDDPDDHREPTREEILDGIPPSSIVEDHLPKYVVYRNADGELRIRFRAKDATLASHPTPGRNMTVDAEAAVDIDGNPAIIEGQHRTVGAAHGQTIPPELGGVPSAPGYLDFEFYPNHVRLEPGPRAEDAAIDDVPDLSREDAIAEWERKYGRDW
jgi:hypothetical protein